MWQALAALFGAAFTAVACYAAGALVIDRLGAPLQRPERIPLAFVLGAACLHLAIVAILALHLGYWPVLVILLAGTIAVAVRSGAWNIKGSESAPLSRGLRWLFGVCFGAFCFVYLFNAWAPESSPDGSSYHLGMVARYLRVHGFERVTTNIYAMLGEGVEMLFVPAFAIGKHSAGALVHFSFAIALALAMLAYGRRIGKPWVGAAGALLMFASPVVGKTGTSAYVDVGVAAIAFSVFYWLEIWDESRNSRLLIPVGLLAGYAFASKYTAFTIGIYAVGFVLWRSKRLRPALLVVAGALAMAGPWIARNWILYQNPVAPMGNWLFRNPYVHVMFEQEWAGFLRRYSLENKWTIPLEVTIRGQNTSGLIGPVFLLLPLALLALRYRAGRRLLVAGALVFSTYFGNVGTRFLIPSLPFFSLALAMAFGESPPFLAALMMIHSVASWPSLVSRYSAEYAWRLQQIPIKEALRIIPQDAYLRSISWGYGVARMIEEKVPKGERVLATGGFPDSYTTREMLLTFQSASNEDLSDTFNMGWNAGARASKARVFQFPEKSLRRLRVLQTAQVEYPEQWNVHEMRLYDHGVELTRGLEWKLRAWPNPWEVQFAFDNSPATRWRSWETAFPGMYLDVDFGRDQKVDEVRLETSPDYLRIRLQVESMDAGGQWEKIADQPMDRMIEPPEAIRRMAMHEIHDRGVHYLVMNDSDYGAEDVRDDPEGWGLKLIGQGYGARLYKTIW